MMKLRKLLAIVLILGLLLGLCVTTEAATPKLSDEYISLVVGGTRKLSVKNTDGEEVKWSSTNNKVATVSSTGKVVAKKAGTAEINAVVGSKKLTCVVSVLKNSPMLSATQLSLTVGETAKLEIENYGNQTVKWSSSKKSIATVSSKGKVKAKKAGSAKIIAKVGKTKLTCKVIVEDKSEEYIAQSVLSKRVRNGSVYVSAGSRIWGVLSPQVRITNSGSTSIDVYKGNQNLLINLRPGSSFVTNVTPNRVSNIWCVGTWFNGGYGYMTVSAVRGINSIW